MVQSSPSKGEHPAVSKWEKESQEATRELLKVKDRLIEVERNVSKRLFEMAQVTFLNQLLHTLMCVYFLFPECNAAGGEGGPAEPAQTIGNSKLQLAGADSCPAETDGLFTGEQHHATDAERQTAGPFHLTKCSIHKPLTRQVLIELKIY